MENTQYVDWSKIPEGYDWACIGDPSYFIGDAYVRIYTEKPKIAMFAMFEDWFTPSEKRFLPSEEMIIGPFPPWRDSLMQRPHA
jgi:hypothetical protein